jgi:uncharacterized protein YodC (DUF2158 family)
MVDFARDEMAEQWKVGDIIRLKAGGVMMTVVKVGNDSSGPGVECTWFDGKKQAYQVFPPDALERYV